MSPYSIPSHETLLGPPGLPTLKYWDDFFIRRFVKTINWDLWRLLSRRFVKKNNQFTKICEDFSEEYLWKQSIHLQLFAFLLLRRRFSCPVCFILIGETNSQSRGIYCTNTAKISNCRKGGNFSSSRQRQSHLPLVAQVAKSFKEVVVDACHSDFL